MMTRRENHMYLYSWEGRAGQGRADQSSSDRPADHIYSLIKPTLYHPLGLWSSGFSWVFAKASDRIRARGQATKQFQRSNHRPRPTSLLPRLQDQQSRSKEGSSSTPATPDDEEEETSRTRDRKARRDTQQNIISCELFFTLSAGKLHTSINRLKVIF